MAAEEKKKSISGVLKELAATTEGLLGLGVMDMEGVPIAVVTPPGSSLNAELAAAQLAVVVRLCSLTSDKLKLGGFDENLISTTSKYILTRPLGANFYLAMILSKDSTTLGMVRMIAKEHADRIYEALPKF
jgi:predicted regulator of Ras-like GTPase activity (Roadblock/LC7/MglB family)